MKIIKYLLFLILILFIAGSIYIATKEGDYRVEESRVIPAPLSLLYNKVNNFSSWQDWSHWGKSEKIVMDLTEESSNEGGGFSWENADMGDGTIYTESTIPYKSIAQQLILEGTVSDLQGNMYWQFEPSPEGTKVTWGLQGRHSFKEKLALILRDSDLDEIFRPVLKAGLLDLERNVVSEMDEYTINVDGVTNHGGGFYMYMTTASKSEEVNSKATQMFQQVRLFMEDNNISLNGEPFVLYNQRDERNNNTIFSAAIPTPSQVITPSGSAVLNGYLPAQKAVKTTLKGNFKNAKEAWDATYQYIEENELTPHPRGTAFEIYITNPLEEENPALWVTEIYIPVL